MKKITEAKMLAAVKKVATHYRRMSCRGRGVPDALAVYRQRTFFVEVKAPGDRISAAQKDFGAKFPTVFLQAHRDGTIISNSDVVPQATRQEFVDEFRRALNKIL